MCVRVTRPFRPGGHESVKGLARETNSYVTSLRELATHNNGPSHMTFHVKYVILVILTCSDAFVRFSSPTLRAWVYEAKAGLTNGGGRRQPGECAGAVAT